MAGPLILARTFKDAHAFAQGELGLSIGHYRVVNSPGTIKAVRGVDLFLVPGWDKRPDRFTMKGAIRWCRLNVVDVEEWREEQAQAPAFIVSAVPDTTEPPQSHIDLVARVLPDGLKPPGVQLTISSAEDVTSFLTRGVNEAPAAPEAPPLPEAPSGDPFAAPETEAPVEETPAEEPKPETTKRRRRRCKECGILVDPDQVDAHAAEHESDLLGGQ